MSKYILLALFVILLSGCVEKRIIKVTTVDRPYQGYKEAVKQQVKRPTVPKEEHIKEEILIKNNPNLGNVKVLVPKNRAILDVNISALEITSSNINNSIKDDIKDEDSKISQTHRVVQRIDFPVEEYINLPKFGNSEVSGSVYLINSETGEKIIKENLKLYLNPVTSYSRQWYEESYLNGNKMTPPDKRLFNYLKFTMSDSNGNFHFFGVPKGDYYLGVRIDCGSECGFDKKRVIRIVKEVYVDGDLREIELSKVIP
jgi:hypothetical protein